jgi:hypothetical protein
LDRRFAASEIVIALYGFLLGREPDDAGLIIHCDSLEAGHSLERVMGAIAASEEFRVSLYRFVRRND